LRGEEQLREELQEFQKEKERIRNIVGQIGGSNSKQNKIVNTLLIIIIAALLILGGVFNRITPSLAVQVAILFGVIKLIWMFYESQRASHFQFWILNSLEFRINEIYKKVKKIEKELEVLKKVEELKQNEE
jgi:Flp pilus assembly protein TadB